jgi:hypothetical protein
MNERGSQCRYARELEIIVFFNRQMKFFKYDLFEQGKKLCIRPLIKPLSMPCPQHQRLKSVECS